MTLHFLIPGKPMSWKRTNYWQGRKLEPKEQRAKKQEIQTYALAAMSQQGWKRTGSSVNVRFEFWGPSPLSDIDNLSKLILDALNGIAWDDDRQVASLQAVKHKYFFQKTVVEINCA